MTSRITSPESPDFEAAKRAQAQAANPAQSAWVQANAGSGKTKVLIDRVTRLLLRRPDGRPGAAPNSILCITYTKAAANEMLSRLYKRLGDWSVASDAALRDKLAILEGRAATAYSADDLRDARALFARALETPGGLRIETIHAFCSRILRRFPLEAGVSPGFQEIEEGDADMLWQAVLSAQLEQVAETLPEALSVLSQATGGRGVDAALEALKYKRQALLAFERRIINADDLRRHILHACGAGEDSPQVIIDKAMSQDFPLRRVQEALADLSSLEKPGKSDEKLAAGLQNVLNETDPEIRYHHYMQVLAGSKRDFPSGSNPFTKAAGAMTRDLYQRDLRKGDAEGTEITRLKQVQDQVAAAAAAERTLALMQIGLPMVAAYAEAKRRRAVLDFDDLIETTRALLTQSDAAPWVLYKLDGGLSHLLLDEAQDTSPSQWALINALVDEFRSGDGADYRSEPRTQFVVGDPKQSIYSFQGADQAHFTAEAETFLRREQPIAQEEGRDVTRPDMAMSFRSTPHVLTFVDTVLTHVPLTDAATDPLPPPDADLRPHAPRRANQPGRVELWPLCLPKPGESEETHWTAPTDHKPADAPRRQLARAVAAEIRALLDRGETIWKEQADGSWQRRALQPQDILILVRRRNDLFEGLIDHLKQENVPVAGADRLRLLDNLGVQDCLNLIRFVLQPADDLTLAEILRGPFCGLVDDDAHLFRLAYGRTPGESLWQRLQAATDAVFQPAYAFCTALLAARDLPAFDFLSGVLCQRQADGLSGWDRLVQRLGEPVRDPINALLNAALGYDMTGPASLQSWLADIEGQDRVLKRELGEPEDAVRVMTVHGAKGLQAPLVILPDTTAATDKRHPDLFFTAEGVPIYSPSKTLDCAASRQLRDAADQASERESRRLLYVALTRASDRLIIAGAGLRSPAIGYHKSAWYRWCLLAMRALDEPSDTDDIEPDTPPEERLYFGPKPPLSGPEIVSVTDTDTILPDWLYRAAPAAHPPMRLAAPSRLTEDRGEVMQPFGAKRQAALRRGQLIHELLQRLPHLAIEQRAPAARAFLERAADLEAEAQDEILMTSLQVLQVDDFRSIFDPVGRSEAAIVGTLPSGQMVNGRVDRLLITPEEVLIIDYKTDRPAPARAADVGEAYLVQMAAYRAVLQAIYTDQRPVRCALLYTDGPRLLELDGALMSESLNRVTSPV